ncbi:S-ribosylhomocysteinase [Streptococcus pneumoniae]|nr:S-ribosylhomocysteinase [Streptococcus pneumoniae]
MKLLSHSLILLYQPTTVDKETKRQTSLMTSLSSIKRGFCSPHISTNIPPLCQVLDTYFFQISNQLFLLYFNFKIGFFKSLFIRSAYTTWSTTSDIVVILCPASLEDAPQWYILCLSVFQSMIIYLSWNSPPDF